MKGKLQLSATDLSDLERLLLDSGAGDRDDIKRADEQAHGLGLFIRSLVGLDRQAATQGLLPLSGRHRTHRPDQIDFVDLIVSELTANDVMDASRLCESPFTDHAPGPRPGLHQPRP